MTPKMTTAVDKTFLVANRAARGAIKMAPGLSACCIDRWLKSFTDALHSLVEPGSGSEFGKGICGIEAISREGRDGA
jgi:hypothetical protein